MVLFDREKFIHMFIIIYFIILFFKIWKMDLGVTDIISLFSRAGNPFTSLMLSNMN